MTDDDSVAARAIRLRAARVVTGVEPADIAEGNGRSVPPDLAHILAAEAGKVSPDFALQGFYRRELKLTAEFLDNGEVHRIPADVEAKLFAALKRLVDGK